MPPLPRAASRRPKRCASASGPAHVHVDRRELLVERDLEERAARRQRRVVDDEPDVEIGELVLERVGRIGAREIERDAAHLHRREAGDLPLRGLESARGGARRAPDSRRARASARANAAPIPSEAPAISAHGP